MRTTLRNLGLVLSALLGIQGLAASAATAVESEGQWTRQFGTSGADEAVGTALDAVGNAYVVGWVYGALPDQAASGTVDAFVRKYDEAGSEVWTRQFGSWDRDFARALAVDPAGSIYVVGEPRASSPVSDRPDSGTSSWPGSRSGKAAVRG